MFVCFMEERQVVTLYVKRLHDAFVLVDNLYYVSDLVEQSERGKMTMFIRVDRFYENFDKVFLIVRTMMDKSASVNVILYNYSCFDARYHKLSSG